MNLLLGAIVFGSLAYLSIAACEAWIAGLARSGTLGAELLRISLCLAAAAIGATLFAHAAPPEALFAIAILCAALGATCYLTGMDSRVPAAVPSAALAILIGTALLQSDLGPLTSAAVTGLPFAATAAIARGRGADWRDSIVAALGGAAFGIQVGIFVVCFACVTIAVMRPYLARHRTNPQPPPRFASVLAGSFMLVLLGQLAVS